MSENVVHYNPFALQHRGMECTNIAGPLGIPLATVIISRSTPNNLRLDVESAQRDYNSAVTHSNPRYRTWVEKNLEEAQTYDADAHFRNPTSRARQFNLELGNHNDAVRNLPALKAQHALGVEVEQAISRLSRKRRFASAALGTLLMGAASLGFIETINDKPALENMSESVQSYVNPDADGPHFDSNLGLVGGGLSIGLLAGWAYGAVRRRSFAQAAAERKLDRARKQTYGQHMVA